MPLTDGKKFLTTLSTLPMACKNFLTVILTLLTIFQTILTDTQWMTNGLGHLTEKRYCVFRWKVTCLFGNLQTNMHSYDYSLSGHKGLLHITALSPWRNNVPHFTVFKQITRQSDVCSWFQEAISNSIINWNLASAFIRAKKKIWTLYINLNIKFDFQKTSIINKHSTTIPSHIIPICFAVNNISIHLNLFKCKHSGDMTYFAFHNTS